MKKKIKQMVLTLAIPSLLMTSCATIFTGTKDRISFNTTPSGATIYKDGVEQCKTPCSVNVSRSLNSTDIEIKLDSYETKVITLDKGFNVVSVINLGNLIGWGVDALSGAIMKYDKKSYDITLNKNSKTSRIDPSKINIDTKKNVVEVFVMQKTATSK